MLPTAASKVADSAPPTQKQSQAADSEHAHPRRLGDEVDDDVITDFDAGYIIVDAVA